MADITVTRTGDTTFSVEVKEGTSRTTHDVTATTADLQRYGGQEDPARLLEASFEFLLERYSSFLHGQRDKCGITVLDSCEAKSDENLRYFHAFLRKFSSHLESQYIVESTLFMESHTTNMLQVADVCANVFYRYHATGGSNADEYDRIKGRIVASKEWP